MQKNIKTIIRLAQWMKLAMNYTGKANTEIQIHKVYIYVSVKRNTLHNFMFINETFSSDECHTERDRSGV